MILPDVNILVYAFRPHDQMTEGCRDWFESEIANESPFGTSELVLSAFIRVVTNPRWYPDPASTREALEFCEWLLDHSNCVVLRPQARFWQIFADLCRIPGVRGNLVPDAFHAALAVESNATFITFDGDYGRFPNLNWQRPF